MRGRRVEDGRTGSSASLSSLTRNWGHGTTASFRQSGILGPYHVSSHFLSGNGSFSSHVAYGADVRSDVVRPAPPF